MFFTLPSLLSREINKDWKILDVGCGRFSPLKWINKGVYRVGLDFYAPYIEESKKLGIHNKYILGDVRNLPFDSNSFDCVIATEVLEHLTKEDGLKMIKEMERVAKKKIILTTPNGYLATYAGPEDNPEEKHLSGWTIKELKKIGFQVRGLNGLKYFWKIKNGQAIIRFGSQSPFRFLIWLTELFVYYYPSLAFQLFFLKNKK